jgi:hypothetical protein
MQIIKPSLIKSIYKNSIGIVNDDLGCDNEGLDEEAAALELESFVSASISFS